MKVKVKMLKDYYLETGKHLVWWKGDIIEIDEVKDQVNLDYLLDEGYIEIIE